jgi:hypothetical protein
MTTSNEVTVTVQASGHPAIEHGLIESDGREFAKQTSLGEGGGL